MVIVMTKVITYCDHCGKTLNEMEDYPSSEIEIAYTEFEADLCKGCYEQLVKLVKNFCSKGERKTEDEGQNDR